MALLCSESVSLGFADRFTLELDIQDIILKPSRSRADRPVHPTDVHDRRVSFLFIQANGFPSYVVSNLRVLP